MSDSNLVRRVAWAPEADQGAGPDTDWQTDGVLFRFLRDSIDPSAFQEEMLPDERARQRILGHYEDVHSIKGSVEFPLESYMTGSEDTDRDDADQAPETEFMSFWAKALGRLTRATSLTAAGTHSTSTVEVADASSWTVGDWVGCPDSDGNIHPRRIDDITSDVATLHAALPFTPQDDDIIRGLAYADIDESYLVDSGGAADRTLAFLLMVGTSGNEIGWDARGCVPVPTGITLERNAVPKVSWNIMAASFLTPHEVTVPSSFSNSPAGEAGIHVGTSTKVLIGDFGSTTVSSLHVPSFSITPGISRVPVDTQTEVDTGMPGRSHYTLGEEPCTVEMTVTPHADDNLTDFENDTLKHILYSRLSTDGKGFAFYFPRAQINPRPAFAPVADAARGQTLNFKCLDDVDNAPAGAVDGWGSRMTVIFA